MTRARAAALRPRRALALPVAAALATTCALAAWQFSRGLEKTALEDARRERLRSPPMAAADFTPDAPGFTRVAMTGRYDAERQFLVAPRPGARPQLVSPLRTEAGVFLVNRGRIPASSRSTALERLPTPAERVTVVGVAWPRAKPSRFVERQPWPDGWPKRIRAWNPARMAALVEARPREMRLEAGGPGVFEAASLAWDYDPGRHWSYAVQWLLLGVAVGVGYVVVGKRRHRAERPGD